MEWNYSSLPKTSTVQPLKFGNGWVISSHISNGCNYLSSTEIINLFVVCLDYSALWARIWEAWNQRPMQSMSSGLLQNFSGDPVAHADRGISRSTLGLRVRWTASMVGHDDVIKWKHFPRYWPFVRGIHRSPVNSPHKGQWRGALMFSVMCVGLKGWINNRQAGDLRRYRVHYDVTVMVSLDQG